jgi:glycosyltransferase involved in cell wall biosynthesis
VAIKHAFTFGGTNFHRNLMTEKPKVSFVIPCHNDGHFIRRAISSVEECEWGLYEIIVVDDGSSDDMTTAVMSDLSKEGFCVLQQANKGPAAARNAGIEAASCEYILPLDSDNKIRPDFVKEAIAVLDTRPEIGIVYSDFQYFGLADHICKISPFDIRKMLSKNYIDTCAMYRRTVWKDCGGYDEHPLIGLEDWEFWLNAYSHGGQFLHLDIVGFDYAYREGSHLSKAKEPENWRKAEQHIYAKHAGLLKDCYRDYQRWDYHCRELRNRPIRTLFRLFAGAIWPRLHNRIYKIN